MSHLELNIQNNQSVFEITEKDAIADLRLLVSEMQRVDKKFSTS